jgi:hypothetical protein
MSFQQLVHRRPKIRRSHLSVKGGTHPLIDDCISTTLYTLPFLEREKLGEREKIDP